MGRPKNFDNTNKNAELGIAIGNKEYWGKGKFIHRYRYSMLKEEYQSLFNSL